MWTHELDYAENLNTGFVAFPFSQPSHHLFVHVFIPIAIKLGIKLPRKKDISPLHASCWFIPFHGAQWAQWRGESRGEGGIGAQWPVCPSPIEEDCWHSQEPVSERGAVGRPPCLARELGLC